MQRIMPVTDLQRTAGQILSEVAASNEPVVITHRGRPAAVLLSASRYAEMEADLRRLDELELADMVQQARAAREAGNTLSHKKAKDKLQKTRVLSQKPKRRTR